MFKKIACYLLFVFSLNLVSAQILFPEGRFAGEDLALELRDEFKRILSLDNCLDMAVFCSGVVSERDVVEYFAGVNEVIDNAVGISRMPHFKTTFHLVENELPNSLRSDASAYQYPSTLLDEEIKPEIVMGSEVYCYILEGKYSRSFGLNFEDGKITFLLGSDVVRERISNYPIFQYSFLIGLNPLWGLSNYCQDDVIEDTPIHSGVNYDCSPNHLSSCTNSAELPLNFMDGRFCKSEASFTEGQLQILKEIFGEISSTTVDCKSARQEDSEPECMVLLEPNPIGGNGILNLTVNQELITEENFEADIIISRGGRVVSESQMKSTGSEKHKFSIQLPNLPPGSYTVEVLTSNHNCAKILIVH